MVILNIECFMSYKGIFKPKNPSKYRGNVSKIIYRSSLELRLMNFLDTHSAVVWWSSEELWVPYVHPKDGKIHKYFPDFIIGYQKKDGSILTEMVEVKPFKETIEPVLKKTKNGSRYTRQSVRSLYMWKINQSKWKSARQYCLNKEWIFRHLTEKDLTPNGRF